jgi:ABC-type thiamine transport system substrate-binding protein
MLNRVVFTKGSPQADVLFGVDNTFLSRALEEGIFESYTSPLLANVGDDFKEDLSGMVTPISFGDVCINYDKQFFSSNGLAVPQSLDDLLKPNTAARFQVLHCWLWKILPHPRQGWRSCLPLSRNMAKMVILSFGRN